MAGVGTTRGRTLSADLTDESNRGASTLAGLPWRLAAYFALVAAYAVFHPPRDMWRSARQALTHVDLAVPWREAAYVTNVVDALLASALVVVASVAASRVARAFDGSVARALDGLAAERWLVFGLAALALMVVPAAAIGEIASLTGTTLLRPPLGLLLTALPALVVAWRLPRDHREALRSTTARRMPAATTVVLAVAAAAAFAPMLAISLTHLPNGYEALMYHAPLAATVWKAGNLTSFLDASPQNVTLAHPLAVEVWCGVLLWIGGERLADLGQLPFAALGAVSVYVLARRSGLLGRGAQLAAASFLLLPMTITQSGMQHDDLSGGAIAMAALALAAAPGPWSTMRLAAIGAGLGLAVTTKVALLPQAAAVWAWIAFVVLVQRPRVLTRATRARDSSSTSGALRVKPLAIAVLAFLVVVAPWWGRNLVRYYNPVYPADIPLIGLGRSESEMTPKDHEYVASRPRWALYPLQERHSDRSAFGALFASFALPGFLVALRRARSRAVLLQALNLAVSLPVWWLMTRHEPRFLIATFAPMFAFVPWALVALPHRQRALGSALLAVAGVFSAVVTVGQALLPLAQQPRERLAYYERVWGVDPAAVELADHEPMLLHTSYASTTYPALYPLMGRSLDTLVLTIDGAFPTEEIVARMRWHGVRHAYVSVGPDPAAEAEVAKMYDAAHFEVAHVSTVTEGRRAGTHRYLFRLREP